MFKTFLDEIVVDRRSIEPVHEQLIRQLENILSKGRFSNHQEIISAEDLAEIIHIDIKDVKKAYDYLSRNDYITYIDGMPRVSRYSRIVNFFNKMIFVKEGILSLRKEPSIDLIAIEVVTLNHFDLLDINQFKDKRFLKQSRLYRADGNPYIYLEEYYPIELYPELLDIDKGFKENIYLEFIRKNYDTVFTKHKRHINVNLFDQEVAMIMGVKKGLPGFKVNMVSYDQNMKAFSFGYGYTLPYFYFEFDNDLT